MSNETVILTKDPAWPWSLPPFGSWALALVGLALVALTIWTYLGVKNAGWRRVGMILCLRLAALVLVCFMILRPSLAFRETARVPSTLLIAVDGSESMTIKDEHDGQSRWEALQRVLGDCEPYLLKLRDEQNITLLRFRFAENVGKLEPEAKADGKRTDFGDMLQALYADHSRERNLRGLIILSDGADNGTRVPALTEAARWRNVPCPIYTFGLGQQTTSDRQRDIAFTSIQSEPASVYIKGKMTVKGTIDAPGFENAAVTLRLLIDDKEILAQPDALRKTLGNSVAVTTDAPSNPGEIKVTLKVDPLPGELATTNNEISTFVTVTKEGIKVLFVDKPRFPEPQRICDALEADPRIRLYMAWRRTDDKQPRAGQADLFQFDSQHYDVIILGDLSARRLTADNPQALAQIHELVKDKGTGLLMMGGYDAFGNSDWSNTDIAKLLPVQLNERGQIDGPLKFEPTREGLAHYVLRQADNPEDNRRLWAELPPLNGMTRLGREKPGATVLATRQGSTVPVLVGQKYGTGRTLAFAGDTTWQWERLGLPKKAQGSEVHARFWRQLVLWLAKQDEVEGNAWIKPDTRRLPAGSKLGFNVGLRGAGGTDLKNARFDVKVSGPQLPLEAVTTARNDQGDVRGNFWKTDAPGEYRLEVSAKGKDVDGKEIDGKASVRFLVFQDDAERARRAADHDFLNKLAHAGGGKYYRAQELRGFLQELQTIPAPRNAPKVELWPDWRSNQLTPFRTGIFLLFVCLLALEWFLRRTWGLV